MNLLDALIIIGFLFFITGITQLISIFSEKEEKEKEEKEKEEKELNYNFYKKYISIDYFLETVDLSRFYFKICNLHSKKIIKYVYITVDFFNAVEDFERSTSFKITGPIQPSYLGENNSYYTFTFNSSNIKSARLQQIIILYTDDTAIKYNFGEAEKVLNNIAKQATINLINGCPNNSVELKQHKNKF